MNTSLRSLLLTGAALLMASVAQTHAAVVYSDDFSSNPFPSRWTIGETVGSYQLYWTGAQSPWSVGLPANANNNSVYSGAYNSSQWMTSVDTNVPAGVTGWTELTYSLNFQMGGTVVNNYIGVLANRSGTNGYMAGIYTGGSGHIAFVDAYGLAWTTPNVNVAANTWYTFKTTLTYDQGNIQMFSQILDLSGNDLAISPTLTYNNAAYLNPNGFYIAFGHDPADYWSQATQIDNFVVTAVPESSTYALVLGGIATLLLIRRRVQS
jgi:hypothetical protein